MGVISQFGDVVLPVKHGHMGAYNEGLALVMDKGKCGYVDATGRFIVPQQYTMPEGTPTAWGDFHNGVARVLVGDKMGLINTKGDRVLPAQYNDIGVFESGVVPVKKKNKWGYMGRSFTALVEPRYDAAWEMHGGHARIKVGQLFGLVDSTGREVVAPQYTLLADPTKGMLVAAGSGGEGLIDVTGKVRIPFNFDEVEVVDHAIVRVARGTGAGVADKKWAYLRLDNGQYIWKEEGFDAPAVK